MTATIPEDAAGAALMAATEDPWLAALLGRPALRITPGGESPAHHQVLLRLRSEPLFATAKVPVADTGRATGLQDIGFRVVDTTLTFAHGGWSGITDGRARYARPEDRDAVAAIAAKAFVYSRFHRDPVIPNTLAACVKKAWAVNYFRGARGDAMVTVESDGRVAGFLQLLRGPDDALVIDLIAVDPAHARRGLARSMMIFAMCNGLDQGARPASTIVGTQAANAPSVALYEALGFRLRSAQYVLHHHGCGAAYPGDGQPT